jgi:hypothetical protein
VDTGPVLSKLGMKSKVRRKAVHTGTRIGFLILIFKILFFENPDLDTQFHLSVEPKLFFFYFNFF